ncbi:MAG: carotenoid 1,2-hydratase [Alteromonadaceae bacterium]|nr:carotenoid 1,2-hydratase [Alteromonadaceae bacterium]
MRTNKWLSVVLLSGALLVMLLPAFGLALPLSTQSEQQVTDHGQVVPRQSLFAGMQAKNNVTVTPEHPVRLPDDHAPHPDFQLEWWYLTFLLEDKNGAPFNYQFTLFRLARPEQASNWGEGHIWLGHSSLHTESAHWFSEKLAQQGTGVAGYSDQPFTFFIDNWLWQSTAPDKLFPARLHSTVEGVSVSLELTATKPLVKHGEQGVSFKTADGVYRSYYYSQPFIDTTGTINIDGERVAVNGIGWFDHEWTSQLTDENALGWDWFSLHFDDGRKLMVFTMHVNNRPPHTTGTLISADGRATPLERNEIVLTPLQTERVAGRTLPLAWQIQLPEAGIDITTNPFKTKQFNHSRFPYYEGAIRFSGTHNGKGFMELTGY